MMEPDQADANATAAPDPGDAPESKTVLHRWLRKLKTFGFGDARDDLLVAAGAVYGVGYVVWALHASRYNLGLLPAIESQYFIAGLAPTFVIVVAYKLTTLFERGLNGIRTRLGAAEAGLGRWLAQAIIACFWGSLILGIVSAVLSKAFPKLSDAVSVIVIWVFVVSYMLLPEKLAGNGAPPGKFSIDYLTDRFAQGYRLFMVRYLGIAIAILGIVFYSEKVHSIFPQELGGGRPRCATLDLMASTLSEQTQKALFAGPPKPDNQAAHSVDVDVFFASSDYLLVKPRGRSADDRSTYEIRKEALQAITWCR